MTTFFLTTKLLLGGGMWGGLFTEVYNLEVSFTNADWSFCCSTIGTHLCKMTAALVREKKRLIEGYIFQVLVIKIFFLVLYLQCHINKKNKQLRV